MNLLAQLIPGVREIRASLVSGVTWLLTGLVALGGTLDPLLSRPVLGEMTRLLSTNQAIGIGAASVAAYLIGSITVDTTKSMMANIPWFANPSRHASQVIRDHVHSRLRHNKVPEVWMDIVPCAIFQKQLSQYGPISLLGNRTDQLDKVDRLEAEIELRLGLVPPVLALAAALGWRIAPIAAVPVVIFAIALLLQARTYTRQRHELLARNLGLGYANVPALTSLAAYITSGYTHPSSDGATQPRDLAVMIFAALRVYLNEEEKDLLLENLSQKSGTPKDEIAKSAQTLNLVRSPWEYG